MGVTPGWHTTIFPPYFVAGAIFSGFAMVLTLIIPVRRIFGLKNVITIKHLENCAKLTLVTGLLVAYGYTCEYFIAWYSGSQFEIYQFYEARPSGPNSIIWYLQMICNVLVPQALWFKRVRTNVWALFVLSILVNVGMWCERFVIVTMSLQREFLTSMWHWFSPTWVDLGIFAGTICFFTFMFMLFLRLLPIISIAEMKELRHDLARRGELEGRDA
jgi:Ni/Fe-hydrogenase subunit HybB-like protein